MNLSSPDVKSIFGRAMEIASPTARAAYLNEACGIDAGLRSEVEALIKYHGIAGGFMGKPVAGDATEDFDLISERPGTVIGPYKLMEQIGEGGMGLVFVAEQQQPVRRKVALKIIKPGMDYARRDRPLRGRAAGPGADGPSQHRPRLRCRRDGQRPALFRHGAGQGDPDHRVLRPASSSRLASGLTCSSRSARRCSTRTARGSSTATSSRRTSWSPRTTASRWSRSSTSAWPRRSASSSPNGRSTPGSPR